ncbi:ATP-binding protein [Streptomyces sp. I6]|uniref:ATP-binding protein n=1 Tax=Streptomyces sp. I6 TaxID=2483113 RepID=UPI000F44AD38|nr:ATP-binding protein [Streptomyces sp. I6]RNL73195.1 ATP-binding protein [Streptomyces sp. I6]
MTASATPPAIPAAPQPPVTVRVFLQRFSSTPRGARLARHLALHQLHSWGVPHGTETSETAAVLVAELAANAVTHGLVPGRDFELRLALEPGKLIVDVSDPRGECRPPRPGGKEGAGPGAERRGEEGGVEEGGRGLVLVEALADRWSVLDRVPVGKTVRAELDLPPR